MNEKVVIVIPVYKETPSNIEKVSFCQSLRVLKEYPISIVCPKSLNIAKYKEIADNYNKIIYREDFEDVFFYNIAGYNRLLLSESFYQRFSAYQYMLIAQLDTYVFRDELEYWCAQGYDYIGAPIFGRFSDTTLHFNQSRVGNGGLSLRKIRVFIDYFRGKKRVIRTNDIAQRIGLHKKPYTRSIVWLLMAMGWRNTPQEVANNWKYNEDDFWSGYLDGTNYALSKPSVITALDFAFERFPSELYKLKNKLPFGCHAWEKYEYESFWKNYIV